MYIIIFRYIIYDDHPCRHHNGLYSHRYLVLKETNEKKTSACVYIILYPYSAQKVRYLWIGGSVQSFDCVVSCPK